MPGRNVADWKACLREFARILKPSGVLFLTRTNKLCPRQAEFNLPLYSRYPSARKRYFENLEVTTRQDLANYAKYPAVNWFTFHGLRAFWVAQGFQCLDCFDTMELSNKGSLERMILHFVRAVAFLRWLAYVALPGTIVVGIKERNLQ